MKEAGFRDIKVVSQANYPFEAMVNDATAQAVMKNSAIAQFDLKKIKHSVVSIKIHAVKPAN
jgi:hypothetical protein